MTTVVITADVLGALAARVRAGDAAAEAELVEQLYPGILAIACARLRDRDAAREVAQDTMLALVTALRAGRLRDTSKVAPFAHGIAVNIVWAYRRDQRRHPAVEPLLPEHAQVIPTDPVEAQEESHALREALATLEPIDRRILSLTLVDGLTPMAIGEQVGLSAELVRTRKSRSIKKVVEVIRRLTRVGARGHLQQ